MLCLKDPPRLASFHPSGLISNSPSSDRLSLVLSVVATPLPIIFCYTTQLILMPSAGLIQSELLY